MIVLSESTIEELEAIRDGWVEDALYKLGAKGNMFKISESAGYELLKRATCVNFIIQDGGVTDEM